MNIKSHSVSSIRARISLALLKVKQSLSPSMLISKGFIVSVLLIFLIPFYFCFQKNLGRLEVYKNYKNVFQEIKAQATKSSSERVRETYFYERLAKEPAEKIFEILQKKPLLLSEKTLVEIFNKEPALKDYLLGNPYKDNILTGASFLQFSKVKENSQDNLLETVYDVKEDVLVNTYDLADIISLIEGSKTALTMNPHMVITNFSLEKVPLTSTYEVFSLNMKLITRELSDKKSN